jgi:acyl transferase domain-containing protein
LAQRLDFVLEVSILAPVVSNVSEMEDSIAVVGMSCRFPGDSNSPEKLWKMCAEARDCWSEVPKSRYNIDGFYHPDPERNGSVGRTNVLF